ncbi:MAG: hypothetical protein ACQKBW_07470 [Puniceicoccales bacterium]
MLKLLFKPIGCLGSVLATLLVLAVIALIVLFWVAEAWTPKFVSEWMEQHSGFDVQIDDANLELLSQEIVFEDIVVGNPPGFPEESFLHIRGLSVKLPLTAVAEGDWRAREVDMVIDSLTVVIPERGPSNLAAFIDAVGYEPTISDQAAATALADGPQLERFRLAIREVIIENHSIGRPDIARYKVDYVGEFTGVSLSSEVFPEVQQALRQSGLPGFGPAFFRALFATFPVQCFADIEPRAPEIIPDKIDTLIREHGEDAKKALESL